MRQFPQHMRAGEGLWLGLRPSRFRKKPRAHQHKIRGSKMEPIVIRTKRKSLWGDKDIPRRIKRVVRDFRQAKGDARLFYEMETLPFDALGNVKVPGMNGRMLVARGDCPARPEFHGKWVLVWPKSVRLEESDA